MAALIACDKFVLFSNGKDIGVVQFSTPDTFQALNVPTLDAVSRGDQTQASLPKARSSSTQQATDAGDADNVQTTHDDDTQNGQEKTSSEQQSTKPDQPNFIRATAISHSGGRVAVCDDRKYLHIFSLDGSGDSTSWTLLSSRCTARRCTAVCFSPDDNLVLVADKSGDAYSFQTDGVPTPRGSDQDVKQQGDTQKAEKGENREEEGDEDEEGSEGEGKLVLGHLSMLLDVILVDNGRLIVTCDRDEKVRISRFPQAHNIEAYCLGHTEFVIKLAYDEEQKVLLSASGDCTVRAWRLDGQQIAHSDVTAHLPKDVLNGTKQPAVETDKPNRVDNTDRPSIKQISYCSRYRLLFVSMERCPQVLVYRLMLHSGGKGSLSFVTSVCADTADHAEESTAVADVSVSGSALWVMSQAGSKLNLSAYTVSVEDNDKVEIIPVAADSPESKLIETVSQQVDFMTAQEDSESLLPFLWKSTFQDDFKFECNVKRAKPEANGGSKKSPHGKKAKIVAGEGDVTSI